VLDWLLDFSLACGVAFRFDRVAFSVTDHETDSKAEAKEHDVNERKPFVNFLFLFHTNLIG
jgi:hypothetical protein